MKRIHRLLLSVAALTALMVALSAGRALAHHVSCGDTITEDTKLDSDLIDCPGNGIVIGADSLTLDLNGHTIDGDGRGSGDSGINNTGPPDGNGHAGVTIRNGTIRDFGFGVWILASRNVIRGLTVSHNEQGIVLGGFVTEQRSPRNQLEKNLVAHNNFAGISLSFSNRNVVTRNSVFDNGYYGISVSDSSANRVSRNSVSGHKLEGGGGSGIRFDATNDSLVTNNLVFDNALGIELFGDARHELIKKNTITANKVGIDVFEAHGVKIEKNVVLENDGDGVMVQAYSDDTEVTKNTISQNGKDGTHAAAGANGTLILRNVANRNGDDGIDADSAPTTLTKNTANRNRDLGIEGVPGVIDGGGNRARDNGNPLQCLNVACS